MKKIKLNKYCAFILFFLFIISRIFFINTQGVFFDSKEYFNLFANPNYFVAITNGHFPPHEGYIILFWPIFQLVQLLHGNGAYGVIIGQIFLSLITFYCFYEVITYVSDKRVALFSVIIASLTPLFWIMNVTLMMENAYAAYFFISLYLLTRYLKTDKSLFLQVSLLFYSLAILTQTLVALWAPVYLFIVFIKNKKVFIKVLLLMISYFLIFSLANILFISQVSHTNIQTVFFYYYLSKGSEFSSIPFDMNGVLIFGRNFIIPLLRNNTILLCTLSLLSLFFLLKNNKKLFVFGILWILPAVYTNQWWDSLLNGRHALLTGFGLAFLTAYLVKTKKYFFITIVIYLLICSLPALNLLRGPIPYLQEANYAKVLPKDSLLIESHFARPQVQDTFKGKALYVNDFGWSEEHFKKEVNNYLSKKQPVYISGAALSEPYGLFSGPYLHNITLSYKSPFELEPVMSHYTTKIYKTINTQDNLVMYQIISEKTAAYPSIKQLQNSHRRIDYTDPLSWIFRMISAKSLHE